MEGFSLVNREDIAMATRSTRGKVKDPVSPLRFPSGSPAKSSTRSGVVESPASSPLKGPLSDVDLLTESPSFIAKSFYGLKKSKKSSESKSKENMWTLKKPPRVVDQRLSSLGKSGCNLKLLQDSHLNEKLLERIANSPVKQAFLDRCSVEEFRRVFRDEIKQMAEQEKLADRRITRGLSKIVTSKNDDESDYSLDENSEDEICFKISNRGFDVDSVSDSSSLRSEDTQRTPTKRKARSLLISDSGISTKTVSSSSSLSGSPRKKQKNKDEANSVPEAATPSEKSDASAPSSSGRKFFKSKSLRESLSPGNVVWGKGFNLRFVSGNRPQKGTQKKGRKATNKNSGIAFPATVRRSEGSMCTSSATWSSSQSSTVSSGDHWAQPDLPTPADGDGDSQEDLMVNKSDSQRYGNSTPPKTKALGFASAEATGTHVLSEDSWQGLDGSIQEEAGDYPETTADASQRLFSIFRNKKSPRLESPGVAKTKPKSPTRKSARNIPAPSPGDRTQMVIDAGQKKFGATQCKVCNMVYCLADPGDEASHAKFHRRLLEAIKYPGWKSERIVQEFPLECARVVLVMAEDGKHLRKKVDDMFEVMGQDLGFSGDSAFRNPYQKVFLYVSLSKKIEGCCVVEAIKEGFRIIPGDLDRSEASGQRPWCCLTLPEPALIGISRLWVSGQSRRQGVATHLLDAVRQWFDYGTLIPRHMVAFSDPTPDGRKFAQKYIGSPAFLVYKYH